MAKLTFNQTTIEFKEVNSIQLEKITFLNGVKSGERNLYTYDVYQNDTKLPVYYLTILNEGNKTAEYRLYAKYKDSDIKLVHAFYDSQNFPFNTMVNLYSSIDSSKFNLK